MCVCVSLLSTLISTTLQNEIFHGLLFMLKQFSFSAVNWPSIFLLFKGSFNIIIDLYNLFWFAMSYRLIDNVFNHLNRRNRWLVSLNITIFSVFVHLCLFVRPLCIYAKRAKNEWTTKKQETEKVKNQYETFFVSFFTKNFKSLNYNSILSIILQYMKINKLIGLCWFVIVPPPNNSSQKNS